MQIPFGSRYGLDADAPARVVWTGGRYAGAGTIRAGYRSGQWPGIAKARDLQNEPALIIADEKNRAPQGRLLSPQFRRILRFLWPHRRFLVIGAVAALLNALLNSAGIPLLVPALKILLEDEDLHTWIDRSIAQARLGVQLSVRPESEMRLSLPGVGISFGRPRHDSALERAHVQAPGLFVLPQGQSAREWYRRVAIQPDDKPLVVSALSWRDPPYEVRSHEVALKAAPRHWRAIAWAAQWLPRAERPADRLKPFIALMGLMVGVTIASNVFRFISEYLASLAVLRAMVDLRRKLFAKVLKLPMSFFSRNVGDTVSRFVQDVNDVQRGLLAMFGKMIREPLEAAAILVVAMLLDWRITLTMLAVGPAAMFLFWRVGRSVKKANQKLLRGYGFMIGALNATLQTAGVVKAYTAENTERRRLFRIDRKMLGQQKKMARVEAFLSPMLEVLAVTAVFFLAWWMGGRVIRGSLDLAKFGALVFALARLFDPLRKMAEVYTRVQRSAAGAARIMDIFDLPDEAEPTATAPDLATLADRIEFRNVSFVYPEAAGPALDHVNLTIRRGETVAIVGPNGSGKTTLMAMLLRFYDPVEGAVLFDGVDIRRGALRSLRRQFSLVTQESVVFAASIEQNIAYGKRGASPEDVMRAAQRAYAADFIRALPDGYKTVAGERGSTLSGGERQRLAIARAILRDAPILIFDEATSQVDSESEQKIQIALRAFAAGRTTLIVAHRLSTIKFASRIVVMDAGRIVDSGTHDELLTRCPFYHGLCETQLVA